MSLPIVKANPIDNRIILVKMCGYEEEVVTAFALEIVIFTDG